MAKVHLADGVLEIWLGPEDLISIQPWLSGVVHVRIERDDRSVLISGKVKQIVQRVARS